MPPPSPRGAGGGGVTVFAGVVCGLLALLINIRDLLADSLTPLP